jgi:hypothetical protein
MGAALAILQLHSQMMNILFEGRLTLGRVQTHVEYWRFPPRLTFFATLFRRMRICLAAIFPLDTYVELCPMT